MRVKKSKVALRGESVVVRPLDSVEPNDWNPNRMSAEMFDSLSYGLVHDGWLMSQALLIWGSDEDGNPKNLIIDGQHRWEAATKLGLREGPMVFLHGLPEREAKELTVKTNQKRGEWDKDALGDLLRSLGNDVSAINLGFGQEELLDLTTITDQETSAVLDLLFPDESPKPSSDDDDEDGPITARASNQSTFSVKLTAEQDKVIQKAIRLVKKHFDLIDTADALITICVQAMARLKSERKK